MSTTVVVANMVAHSFTNTGFQCVVSGTSEDPWDSGGLGVHEVKTILVVIQRHYMSFSLSFS